MNLAQELQTLYGKFGHLDGITIELQKELIAIGVHNQAAQMTVFLQGAQIASFTPHGAQPVVWMSEQNRYLEGTPLRGGIPICWPWFGDLRRNPAEVQSHYQGDNAHGFARNHYWQLESIESISTNETQLLLTLPEQAFTQQGVSGCHLSLKITVGKNLSCELITTNTGQQPISFSQALHTYLAVSDVRLISVTGIEDSVYIDTLVDWNDRRPGGVGAVTGETDRIYLDCPNTIALHDPEWQRTIALTSRNSRSMVMWNPWVEKAKRLSDFADEDYLGMICLETANLMEDAVLNLSAGESHTLDVTMSVQAYTDSNGK